MLSAPLEATLIAAAAPVSGVLPLVGILYRLDSTPAHNNATYEHDRMAFPLPYAPACPLRLAWL